MERTSAYAQAVHAGSQEELAQWSRLADEYHEKLQAVQGSLQEREAEAAGLRTHNEQLRAHNEALRAHAEHLRLELAKHAALSP